MMGFYHAFFGLFLVLSLRVTSVIGQWHSKPSGLYDALSSLAIWIDKTDQALMNAGIYQETYTPWTQCSATCGIGSKTRYKVGCNNPTSEECMETLFCYANACPEPPKTKKTRYATCVLKPNDASGTVKGLVRLKQTEQGPLTLDLNITGFDVQSVNADLSDLEHGFHVHQYGDLSGGCGSAGGHFNPGGALHGGPDDNVRHVGDLGNIRQTPGGVVISTFHDSVASLFGTRSIIGRAIVVHKFQDDLGRGGDVGSETTGNAGPRLACCVIGLSAQWD